MRHYPVESGNILSIGYDPVSCTMEVVFNLQPTTVYIYQNVPCIAVVTVMFAESVGHAFHETVKKQPEMFPYTKEHR